MLNTPLQKIVWRCEGPWPREGKPVPTRSLEGEMGRKKKIKGAAGIEPATLRSAVESSATEPNSLVHPSAEPNSLVHSSAGMALIEVRGCAFEHLGQRSAVPQLPNTTFVPLS